MDLQSPCGPGSSLEILSLDQIRALRSRNEYTEGPSAVRRPPAPCGTSRPHHKPEGTHQVILINNNWEGQSGPGPGGRLHGGPRAPGLSCPTSSASSQLNFPGRVVRIQPPRSPPPPAPSGPRGHWLTCERCGRCKCSECTAPRPPPARLFCGGLCLCSAQNVVEHGTCMCLVKAAFYHCSADDQGDSCADRPCSLGPSHCAARFLFMGALSLLLPCLLCYPPGQACVRALQGCYDRRHRPGCRCRASNIRGRQLETPS